MKIQEHQLKKEIPNKQILLMEFWIKMIRT